MWKSPLDLANDDAILLDRHRQFVSECVHVLTPPDTARSLHRPWDRTAIRLDRY